MWPGGKQKAATVWPGLHARPLKLTLLLLLLSRFSRVRLCATPEMAAYQAPSSMGFSRQKYWSGVPLPSLQADPTNPLLSSPEPSATPVA